MDLETFHVLPADIQHTGHFRAELISGAVMGKGLHFPRVSMEGRFYDFLPIAGGKAAGNVCLLRHGFIKTRQFLDDYLQGRTLVATVIRI